MVAIDNHPDLALGKIPQTENMSALPVVGIFGPNASGKSNTVDALAYMRWCVVTSHQKWLPDKPISRRPFLLDGEVSERPSEYEADFIVSGVRYNYGFVCSDEEIIEEWLFSYPERRRRTLYVRKSGSPISFGSTLVGPKKLVEKSVRRNSLFLSAAAANNFEALQPVYRWFDRIRYASSSNEKQRLDFTLHYMERHDRGAVIDLLSFADLGVVDMSVSKPEVTPEMIDRFKAMLDMLGVDEGEVDPENYLTPDIEVKHKTSDGIKGLPFGHESTGTRTWLSLTGPILQSLKQGRILVVDELDARLHSTLSAELVRLFQDPITNKNGAQLIFNSHDTTLLGKNAPCRLRRDQVWFAEKDDDGATHLFPLTDYRVREGIDNVQRGYLRGRYGAVPFFDDTLLISAFAEREETDGTRH
ncbi:AAA family ATPase [Actinomadura rubteroloni]|nr:ATP-binding protein [Actinomadura rubteroloni]